MPLALPCQIGKYELQEYLGGGMSQVYRAIDTVIGRTVAVKVLTEEGCADAESKARFLQEARMAGNVAHENVISIFDYGEDSTGRPFMVMEFLSGEDLRHAIKNQRTGDLKNRLRIAMHIARALDYVHSLNITHRDVKPDNVHLTQSGAVKLMDFGIAKTAGLSMTRAGFVMGTPYYMAPEQVMGGEVTGMVDIYAFGVMLYELLLGNRPFAGDTVERIFYSILNEPLNLDALRQAGIPERVTELVRHCTEKAPERRPQGFRVVAGELDAIINEAPTPVPVDDATVAYPPPPAPVAPVQAKSNRLWYYAAAAVLAVGIGGALLYEKLSHQDAVAPPKAAVDMVLVPAGEFLFGPDKRRVTLPAYSIDRTEVTNAAYLAFCKAAGHALPPGFPQDKPEYPVVNVTMADARNYSAWAGKRLPSAEEWEKAARGNNGLIYPWGDEKDPGHANVKDNPGGPKKLASAAGFPASASPYGVLQMVGNVWEFVNTAGKPTPEIVARWSKVLQPPPAADEAWYTIRGESYDEPLDPTVLFDSSTVPARWASETIGFRCVKAP